MQLDLFLAFLAAILVSHLAIVAVRRTTMSIAVWFAMRRMAKSPTPELGHVAMAPIGGFRPPEPLTPDEMEMLAQKCRGLEIEGMSDTLVEELGRRLMLERMRRRSRRRR